MSRRSPARDGSNWYRSRRSLLPTQHHHWWPASSRQPNPWIRWRDIVRSQNLSGQTILKRPTKMDDIQEHCLRNEVSTWGDVPRLYPDNQKAGKSTRSKSGASLQVTNSIPSSGHSSPVQKLPPPKKKSWKLLSLSHKKNHHKNLKHQSKSKVTFSLRKSSTI